MQRSDLRKIYGYPHFQGMTPVQIGDFLDQGRLTHWSEGSQIFRCGETADRFFLLIRGFVRVVRPQPDGTQIIPMHIPAGELFGVAVALGQDLYPSTAVAAADCVTLDWPSASWPELRASYPGLPARLGQELGGRLENLQAHIEGLTTRSVEQRIAAALLSLVDKISIPDPRGRRIGITLTRATLSEMTATTLYTVSRTMSHWQKQGLLISERSHVTLRDTEGLARIRDGIA